MEDKDDLAECRAGARRSQEEEDALRGCRGIIIGVLLGLGMWIALIEAFLRSR